jgi:predicted nucleic acid-binding protein
VLDRGVAAAWRPDRAAITAAFERLACQVEPGPLPLPGLRCTDPDDQMFIDLALCTRSSWLFTRDRALLRLARRARPLGVAVIRPADWRLGAPGAGRGG